MIKGSVSDYQSGEPFVYVGNRPAMIPAQNGSFTLKVINNRDNIDAVNNRLNSELFGLYKYTRDKDDETRKELCDLKAQVAISNAVRPYQDKLIQCEIEKAFTAGINYVDRKTCKMVEGVVVVPTEPLSLIHI